MLHYSTVTAKGQTTIPKEIRERLNLKPGDKIAFHIGSDGRAYIIAKNKTIDDIAGMLHRPGMKALTIEEIDQAIGEEVAYQNDPRRLRGE
jgi:AbrB family looped-hinge helix DNA binding protein